MGSNLCRRFFKPSKKAGLKFNQNCLTFIYIKIQIYNFITNNDIFIEKLLLGGLTCAILHMLLHVLDKPFL